MQGLCRYRYRHTLIGPWVMNQRDYICMMLLIVFEEKPEKYTFNIPNLAFNLTSSICPGGLNRFLMYNAVQEALRLLNGDGGARWGRATASHLEEKRMVSAPWIYSHPLPVTAFTQAFLVECHSFPNFYCWSALLLVPVYTPDVFIQSESSAGSGNSYLH